MECYVSLKMKPRLDCMDSVVGFLRSIEKGEVGEASEIASGWGWDSRVAFETLYYDSGFEEYFSTFERVVVDGDAVILNVLTGSHGYDFAVALMKLLGPQCDDLRGSYEHDEAMEGGVPVELAYVAGTVVEMMGEAGPGLGASSWVYVKIECDFEDKNKARSFFRMIQKKPEEVLTYLLKACFEREGEPLVLKEKVDVSAEVLSRDNDVQGTYATGILVFKAVDCAVWKNFGLGLFSLGAIRSMVMCTLGELLYPAGVRYFVDGRKVAPELYSLAGRRSEPLISALWVDDVSSDDLTSEYTDAQVLCWASLCGAATWVDHLLAKDAGLVGACDENANPPLVNAVLGCNAKVAKRLLEAGADANVSVRLTPALKEMVRIEQEFSEEENLLYWKSAYCYLLNNGFSSDDESVLDWAVSRGDVGVANLLLDYGADLYWPSSDDCQSTVVSCVQGGSPEVLRRILERAVAEGKKEPDFEFWLDQAIYCQRYEMAELFFEFAERLGVKLGGQNEHGETLMHTAVYTFMLFWPNRGVQFLLEHGVELDEVNSEGATPFICAIQWMDGLNSSRMQFLQQLVLAGTNTEAKDNCGKTANCYADERGIPLAQVLALAKKSAK